jgi:hypothetical protein
VRLPVAGYDGSWRGSTLDVAKINADRRADQFRWAVAIVPLLGICCVVITLLVLLGLVELAWALMFHQRLFTLPW